jgi:hypothetical protein
LRYLRQMQRSLLLAALPMLVATVFVGGASSSVGAPSAFLRAATSADRLPGRFATHGVPGPNVSRPYDSRRIATYVDGKQRRWSVYIFKQRKSGAEQTCVFTFHSGGAGGGCNPSAGFFSPSNQVVDGEGRVLAGVASTKVTRIEVIGTQGVVHHVPLSPDHGFVLNCRAYNGCTCVVATLKAFDSRGRLITSENWPNQSCRRP